MANQPTKYRKFVVGAASAALVASAVAPVASAAEFSDVSAGNSHKASIDALVAKGVISGYPDGSFQPNKTLTRSDVVKMMGKWLKAEGYAVPTDYKTNPRFADLTSASNDELLQYAALVKDNGLFIGTPDGKLDPAGNITRENMAIVVVRAFDRVHDIDLATYVAAQDFNKDVTDRASAKAEARPAIDVLDYFDITNPEAPQFNPKGTTTRAQFASFLNKAIETDYSEVGSGVVGTANVKAVNATTVEVTFKDAVENINSLNFTIEGLTVSNAAVKQSDNKTVVLTTAVQKGGEKYTVSLNNEEIGSFEGISAVIPTKVDITTQSVQGKVGQQAIVSADVGVKQAGIPVTFNVKADTLVTLNKDQVFEAVTNADGIATLSYTQYAAGVDEVVAYPTGAPTVRDYATVHWGVDTILTLEEDDKKGASLNNGENKVYKVTYKDPKTGKPVQNEEINVTFAENVDVAINKITDATINGKPAYQTTNDKVESVTVKTDSKGEATFTVSGTNTKATPLVFVDGSGYSDKKANDKLDRTELQVKAAELTFGAVHVKYELEVTRDGSEEAAVRSASNDNGRVYKVAVKDENGKAAAGEVINVAFDEILDKVISTKTDAEFVVDNDDLKGTSNYYNSNNRQQIQIELDSKGEAEFKIVSDDVKGYATPVIWIDINSSNNKEGTLEEGEPTKTAAMTYFAAEKVAGSSLKVYEPVNGPEIKDNRTIDATKGAQFTFRVANQSGKAIDANKVKGGTATFKVENTGTKDVVVFRNSADLTAYLADPTTANLNKGTVISTKRTVTLPSISLPLYKNDANIYVASVGGESASVEVTSYGEVKDLDDKTVNLSESKVAKATFKSSATVGDSISEVVESFDKDKQTIKFFGKDKIDYKSDAADGKVSYFSALSGAKVGVGKEEFERLLADHTSRDITVNYFKNAQGNIELTVLSNVAATNKFNASLNIVDGTAATTLTTPDTVSFGGYTFTASPGTSLNGYNFAVGTIADGATTAARLEGNTIVLSGDFANDDLSGQYASTASVQTAINAITFPNGGSITVGGTPSALTPGAKSLPFANGTDASPGTKEVATLEIAGTARTNTASVTVNGTTTAVTVAVGDSAATVASKIATALNGNVTGYDVTVNGNKVVFTAQSVGNPTNITVTVR